jgi:hypothetical protein
MSYLGRGLEQVDNISKLDNITFNGGTTYALTKDSAAFTPISSNAILISIDGVVQQGNFSVSGTNIVFNFSPTSSNTCNWILHMGTGVAFTPADSSVTKDKANFISTSSAAGLQIKGDGTTDGTLQLNCSQNSHGVKIKSPAHSAGQSYTLTLPTTAPASNKMLQTDGSGNLSFIDTPSGNLVKVASGNTTGGSVSYVDVAGCFTSTYKIYKLFIYDVNTASDTALYMRWLTGSSTEQAGSNAYHYGITGYYSGNSGSNNGGVATYMNLIGEDIRQDADEQFALEGTIYNPTGTTLKTRFNFLSGGRRTGNYTVVGAGSAEWNQATAVTGFRFLTNTGNLDSMYYVVYGLVI